MWFRVEVLPSATEQHAPCEAPTAVVATTGSSAGAVKLTWKPPLEALTSGAQYVISSIADGQPPQTEYVSGQPTQLTGLTPEKTHTFKVAYKNAYGVGPNSATSNPITVT